MLDESLSFDADQADQIAFVGMVRRDGAGNDLRLCDDRVAPAPLPAG